MPVGVIHAWLDVISTYCLPRGLKSLALKDIHLARIEWMLQARGESSADLSPQHWQINPFLYSFVWFLLVSGLFSEFLPSSLFVSSLTFHLWKETVEFDDSISFAPIPQVVSGHRHSTLTYESCYHSDCRFSLVQHAGRRSEDVGSLIYFISGQFEPCNTQAPLYGLESLKNKRCVSHFICQRPSHWVFLILRSINRRQPCSHHSQ